MSDAITPEERALIDAALKAGKARKVKPGTSAVEIKWDPEKNGLRYVDPEQAQNAMNNWVGNGRRRGKKPDPKVAERRIKVRDMMQSGRTAKEIAQALGVPVASIYVDATKIGLKFERSNTVADTKSQRRERIKALHSEGKTYEEMEELTGASRSSLRRDLQSMGLTPNIKRRPMVRRANVAERRAQVASLIDEGFSGSEIAQHLGVKPLTVYADVKALGKSLPKPDRRKTADEKKTQSANRRVREVKDRRRFKIGIPATGEVKKLANSDATGTLYPLTVAEPEEAQSVLKSGANNAKIGGDVLVGHLKGAPIYTLTLEERASCPKTCTLWRECYGNGMNHAVRFRHGPELVERLKVEVSEAMEKHERLLIRLHVLGDFWSREYVDFWGAQLLTYPGLHVFGFTAWKPGTEIGDRIAALRALEPRRFMIRHSASTGSWGSFTIDFRTERKTIGDAVVCPAQLDANEGGERSVHCGSCAACWSSDRCITFIEH